MGKPKEARPAKLFMSLIAREEDVLSRGLESLLQFFGEIDFKSGHLPFDFTDYYADEMGADLFRHFVTFRNLIPIPRLPEIKHETNRVEGVFADSEGRRRLNIDPGYLCLENVVLATTKGYSHRPYLRDGIYADLTLMYRDQSFQALAWTYPDYRQQDVIQLFNQVRKRYVEDFRKGQRQDD